MPAEWAGELAPGWWRQRLLAWEGPRVERLDAERRARALTPLPLTPGVGEAWFPLVTEAAGDGPDGVLIRVSVGGTGALLPVGLREAVAAWVAELVGRTSPVEPPDLRVSALPPRWELTGRSLELAAATAWVSHLLHRAPRVAPVASGRLSSSCGRVEAVGYLDRKRAVCARELWLTDSQPRLVGAPDSALGWLGEWLGADWRRQLALALGAHGNPLARRARSLYERRDYGAAQRQADIAADTAEGDARAVAWWIGGATRLHQGRISEALPLLEQALAHLRLQDHPERELFLVEELTAYLGVALLDAMQPLASRAALTAALDVLLQVPPGLRGRRWREVVLQLAGTLRRVHATCGDLAAAFAVNRDLTLGEASLEPERSRGYLDLADLHLRAGDVEAAREALREAEAALPLCDDGQRTGTARYLQLFGVRAGLWRSSALVEPPDLRRHPQPIEVLQSLLEQGRGSCVAYAEEHLDPDACEPLLCLAVSGEAARAVERFGTLPWATRLAERLLREPELAGCWREPLEDLAAGRAAAWLARAPY